MLIVFSGIYLLDKYCTIYETSNINEMTCSDRGVIAFIANTLYFMASPLGHIITRIVTIMAPYMARISDIRNTFIGLMSPPESVQFIYDIVCCHLLLI